MLCLLAMSSVGYGKYKYKYKHKYMLCLLAMSSVGEWKSKYKRNLLPHTLKSSNVLCWYHTHSSIQLPQQINGQLAVGTWEPIVGAILDEFPKLRNHRTLVYFVT